MSPTADIAVGEVTLRSSAVVDLGVVRVLLQSNVSDFPAFSYFARFAPEGTPCDYEIVCVDLDHDELDVSVLAELVDDSFRGKRFRSGYYLVHYFGEPAYLITRGNRFYVFGRSLEKTVWPYFVKHILTLYAADHGFLHLKAGAFVQQDAGATLLFGRNGGGKTVFLSQACMQGATFLTNTHLMVKDRIAHGVPSSIRVREDEFFRAASGDAGLKPHMETGSYLTDPADLFAGRIAERASVRNLVIVDFNPKAPAAFEETPDDVMIAFLSQFSFAPTTYGLRDDILAHCENDINKYAAIHNRMSQDLVSLISQSRCFRANVDMLDESQRAMVLDRLAS